MKEGNTKAKSSVDILTSRKETYTGYITQGIHNQRSF
jgi:hypothetical protein